MDEDDRYDLMDFFTRFRDPHRKWATRDLGKASAEPVIDDLTRKVTAFLRTKSGARLRAIRKYCPGCRTLSAIPGLPFPGSQATHLLAYHRDDLSPLVLEFVQSLECEGVDPTDEELTHPKR